MNNVRKPRDRHSGLDRRQFITTALTGAGALMASTHWAGAAEAVTTPTKRKATDIVSLGKTGVKVSRLAQGTGVKGGQRASEHTRMGLDACARLVRQGLDQGITFMDTADLYGTHGFVQKGLEGVDRDKYTLLSKIWPREEYWNMASGGARREVDRFRKEFNTDVLDICLIHCMTHADWPQTHERIRDELSEMKEKGIVRAVGVSCHDLGALKVAASHRWVDIILSRINNTGAMMDGPVEVVSAVLKQARANGKVVVGMKIFGEGRLVQPDQKDASLKYVFDNDLVDAVTIGMLNPEQMRDTIERMNKALS